MTKRWHYAAFGAYLVFMILLSWWVTLEIGP